MASVDLPPRRGGGPTQGAGCCKVELTTACARWPRMVVAAQGPIIADGVRRLDIEVNVVGARFSIFHGVLDALASMRSSAASRSPPTSRSSLENGVMPWCAVRLSAWCAAAPAWLAAKCSP
ncbi:hypothetical protein OsI_19724 [Oryza sativa Indica Group]|uniref:Uncharacterized protein n=1 Tax=Oryza sativa subsp. indica TaxID=39946 RepID=A2Y3Z5_ORYSI|nr:hypothetical protein OsI_19724 [Oryza sativa Indica Group]